jgi:hypothetical protein
MSFSGFRTQKKLTGRVTGEKQFPQWCKKKILQFVRIKSEDKQSSLQFLKPKENREREKKKLLSQALAPDLEDIFFLTFTS